jgi:dihydropteroate synthase
MTGFTWGERTFVMGIINITPDSFSGDGLLIQEDYVRAAVDQARQFAADGADILDIGGESTRPGSNPLDAQLELDRILPVIRRIKAEMDIPVSVDTYKALVAREALAAGADWINDVWALQADPDMAKVAAWAGCPVVLMHNRSKPNDIVLLEQLGGMYRGARYNHLMDDVKQDLLAAVQVGLQAGIKPEQIILDPGIGFGKTVAQNLELINRLDEIRSLGYPVLLGPSRKSFIGQVLDVPAADRLEGMMAAVCVGVMRGADIVRVHDVKETVRVVRMTEAILRSK